ncbi:MAG: hypothetical protein ACXW4Q_04625 [Anaerolineales bacterium]
MTVNMKWKKRLFTLVTIGLAMLFATVSIAAADTGTKQPPLEIDPDDFVSQIDNPYFPLKPGTTFIYRGENEGAPTRTEVIVTDMTKEILGVNTTVVRQLNYEDGVLIEDTLDWFAQDKDGNVWYFGEDTKAFDENGNVSTEGSWEAGVDGAQPGIIMLAHSRKGDRYQQEFYPGEAEGMAQVLGYKASLCVRYGCFKDVLQIKEWSPLDPGIVEHKYYAKGVGFIFATVVKGGEEQVELVRVRRK